MDRRWTGAGRTLPLTVWFMAVLAPGDVLMRTGRHDQAAAEAFETTATFPDDTRLRQIRIIRYQHVRPPRGTSVLPGLPGLIELVRQSSEVALGRRTGVPSLLSVTLRTPLVWSPRPGMNPARMVPQSSLLL
jgi:hypothetical protein